MPNTLQARSVPERIRANQLTIGSWLQLADPNVVEIMARAGFDWLAIDMEHGSISVESLPNLIRAIEVAGVFPFVRVYENNPVIIKRALDAGARGIIAPMVATAEEAKQAVASSKYPPDGIRGVGFSRANLYGRNFSDYVAKHNREVVVIVQIEHIRGVENAAVILAIPGVDGYMVGPYDLSGSMGLTAQFEHPRFVEAVARVKAAGDTSGKACGLHIVTPDTEILRRRIEEGHTFIAYGIDGVFLHGAAFKHATDARACLHK